MSANTKKEIKEALRHIGIQRVEFGNWDGIANDDNTRGETSSLSLCTQNGHVEVEAALMSDPKTEGVKAVLIVTDHGI